MRIYQVFDKVRLPSGIVCNVEKDVSELVKAHPTLDDLEKSEYWMSETYTYEIMPVTSTPEWVSWNRVNKAIQEKLLSAICK